MGDNQEKSAVQNPQLSIVKTQSQPPKEVIPRAKSDRTSRYSAINQGVEEFRQNDLFRRHLGDYLGYKLALPKVLIAITCYNESSNSLYRTICGISENFQYMSRDNETEKVNLSFAVVAVFDGRKVLQQIFDHKNEESIFTHPKLGLSPKDAYRMKRSFQEIDGVNLYMFYTTVLCESGNVTVCYMIKEKNKGKIDSQYWYLKGICSAGFDTSLPDWKYHVPKDIYPSSIEYLVMLDCGTIPEKNSIRMLIEKLCSSKDIGGVCGEISTNNLERFNLLIASQHFEYKISHIMDKSCDSVVGYISVLPGAFSAYRWEALKGEPLDVYFYTLERLQYTKIKPTKGDAQHNNTNRGRYDNLDGNSIEKLKMDELYQTELISSSYCFEVKDIKDPKLVEEREVRMGNLYNKKFLTPFANNVYLTEDRLICVEIILKKDSHYHLEYVKNAVAKTDVPDSLDKLLGQRRRWLNGTLTSLFMSAGKFFAGIFRGKFSLRGNNHGIFRLLMFFIHFLYLVLTSILGLLTIGTSFISYYYLIELSFEDQTSQYLDLLKYFLIGIFLVVLFSLFIFSIGSKPDQHTGLYNFTRILLAGISVFSIVAIVISIDTLYNHQLLFWGVVSTFCSQFVCAILHGEIFSLITVAFQYYFMLPTYLLLFQTYAIANLHDYSWGNREVTGEFRFKNEVTSIDKREKNDKFIRDTNNKSHVVSEITSTSFRSFWFAAYIIINYVYVMICIYFVKYYDYGTVMSSIAIFVMGYKTIGSLVFLIKQKFSWKCCDGSNEFKEMIKNFPLNQLDKKSKQNEQFSDEFDFSSVFYHDFTCPDSVLKGVPDVSYSYYSELRQIVNNQVQSSAYIKEKIAITGIVDFYLYKKRDDDSSSIDSDINQDSSNRTRYYDFVNRGIDGLYQFLVEGPKNSKEESITYLNSLNYMFPFNCIHAYTDKNDFEEWKGTVKKVYNKINPPNENQGINTINLWVIQDSLEKNPLNGNNIYSKNSQELLQKIFHLKYMRQLYLNLVNLFLEKFYGIRFTYDKSKSIYKVVKSEHHSIDKIYQFICTNKKSRLTENAYKIMSKIVASLGFLGYHPYQILLINFLHNYMRANRPDRMKTVKDNKGENVFMSFNLFINERNYFKFYEIWNTFLQIVITKNYETVNVDFKPPNQTGNAAGKREVKDKAKDKGDDSDSDSDIMSNKELGRQIKQNATNLSRKFIINSIFTFNYKDQPSPRPPPPSQPPTQPRTIAPPPPVTDIPRPEPPIQVTPRPRPQPVYVPPPSQPPQPKPAKLRPLKEHRQPVFPLDRGAHKMSIFGVLAGDKPVYYDDVHGKKPHSRK